MTERFMLDDAGELIDLNNHKFIDYGEECCNLLNELHDECEFLKIENEALEDGATVYAELCHKLSKENEQLKYNYNEKCNEYCGLEEQVDILLKENEQLKKQNKKLQEKIKKERSSFKKTQERYSKEAEAKIKELAKENSEYHKIVNCGNCHFHNYDWYDDGDEFEVCDKGNTERLMYHQFCKDWVEL